MTRKKLDDTRVARIEQDARERLARMAIGWSLSVLLLLALIVIAVPTLSVLLPTINQAVAAPRPDAGERAIETAKAVFGLVIPIVSGTLGAIFAYYFANRAQEEANRNTEELVKGLSSMERWRSTPLKNAMRLLPEVDYVEIERSSGGRVSTPLAQVLEIIERRGRSRVPLVEYVGKDPHLLFVVHESTVFDFLRRRADVANPAVDDLLSDQNSRARLEGTLGHVAADASLSAAKLLMDSNRRLQDVAVTTNGRPDGALVGWLTNVDVFRHCIAGVDSAGT